MPFIGEEESIPSARTESNEPGIDVETKLFGLILIFLATLGGMPSWRDGIDVSDFYLFLFVAGIFLLAVRAIRQARGGR